MNACLSPRIKWDSIYFDAYDIFAIVFPLKDRERYVGQHIEVYKWLSSIFYLKISNADLVAA